MIWRNTKEAILENNQSAILEAAYKGDLDKVQSLVQQDPEIARMQGSPEHWEGATPLILVALGGHLEIAVLLIEHGANVNPVSQDGSALLMAVWGGHLPMVRLLLERGADPNVASASGETPLMAAAYKGFLEIGQLLIKKGAILDCRTTVGTTDFFKTSPPVCGESPLHLAAAYGHTSFVELLLHKGADINIKDHTGQTPKHWAARYGKEELIPLFK